MDTLPQIFSFTILIQQKHSSLTCGNSKSNPSTVKAYNLPSKIFWGFGNLVTESGGFFRRGKASVRDFFGKRSPFFFIKTAIHISIDHTKTNSVNGNM